MKMADNTEHAGIETWNISNLKIVYLIGYIIKQTWHTRWNGTRKFNQITLVL
jgi:hypothetical protein